MKNSRHTPHCSAMTHATDPETNHPDETILEADMHSELRALRYRQSLFALLKQLGAE